MGVPAFYRWLADKYPKIVVDCQEADPAAGPVDASLPNPNGIEFDCLYLDMNGIIHPCARPEGKPPPATHEEMYAAIFKYIDRVFSVVRPRKMLFMAIDGPAPRAKMNQQRTRRFKAAKERADKAAETVALRAELKAQGREPPPPSDKTPFDSNVITPGTMFMANLARWLRYYVQLRLHSDPGWAGIKVIFSDASVPGEGEHKIMEHIRRQRTLPGYEADTRHVIHGLDADLIMLALATHEPHFCILREVVLDRKAQEKQKEEIARGNIPGPPKMQFLHVWTLREYLQREYTDGALDWSTVPGGFDLERVIDDFVFLCFFVGNDFLPHIPAVEIRDGAIDMLIYSYKALLPTLGGYITDAGRVHLPRAETVLREVAAFEDEIFGNAKKREEGRARAAAARAVSEGGTAPPGAFGALYPPKDPTQKQLHAAMKAFADAADFDAALPIPATLNGFHKASFHLYVTLLNLSSSSNPDGSFTVRCKKGRKAASSAHAAGGAHHTEGLLGADEGEGEQGGVVSKDDFDNRLTLRLQKLEEQAAAQPDVVRYGEGGWKERYYEHKLHVGRHDEAMKRYVVGCYVQGLCWTLMYYYQGVQDWGWFYPFHYAPCASDIVGLADFAGGQFSLGAPFTPFQQLMAVFPPSSGHALPDAYRTLMVHPQSPIIDFYPIDFRQDLNGKKYSWQAIALLPFIDAERLRSSVGALAATLGEEETERNTLGAELVFANRATPIGALCAAHCGPVEHTTPLDLAQFMPSFGGTLTHAGKRIGVCGTTLPGPSGGAEWGLGPVPNCAVAGGVFTPPAYSTHKPRLLPTVTLPPMVLEPHDKPQLSRDSEQACRSLANRFYGGGGGGGGRPHGGGGRYGGGGGGGRGGGGRGGGGGGHHVPLQGGYGQRGQAGPPRANGRNPADRIVNAQLGLPRR